MAPSELVQGRMWAPWELRQGRLQAPSEVAWDRMEQARLEQGEEQSLEEPRVLGASLFQREWQCGGARRARWGRVETLVRWVLDVIGPRGDR